MHNLRNIFFLLLAVVVGAQTISSCSGSSDKTTALSKAEKAKAAAAYKAAFKVGVMPTMDCLPFFVAKECSLFDTTKVDVRLVAFNSEMDCDTALTGGSVECAVGDICRRQYLQAKGAKLDYLIQTNSYWQLLSGKRARVTRASQLGDKIIGITRYSACDMAAGRALQLDKPKQQAYSVQINNVFVRLDMLTNNEIDAIVATEPQATQARLAHARVLYSTDNDALHLGAFAFRRSEQHDRQIPFVIKGYNAAVDSINKNGFAHYAYILKKYMKLDDKTIAALPKLKYKHASRPMTADLKKGRINNQWLKQLYK